MRSYRPSNLLKSLARPDDKVESIESKRSRLLYQSKKRGILENDIILGEFAEKYLKTMSPQELESYHKLINGEHMEWDLFYFLSGRKSPPEDVAKCSVYQKGRQTYSSHHSKFIYRFSGVRLGRMEKMVFDPRTLDNDKDISQYRDQRFQGSMRDQEVALRTSTTLYIGNLSYYTKEDQVYELFGRAGDVRRVIMGLDRFKKTPCGFCFVEYYTREDAEVALQCITNTRLDDRIIRCDWDAGFLEGRQYGRGKHGGQVRDEYRKDFDPERGGWNRMIAGRAEANPMGAQ
ncbi:unnamed protein product [Caenorhabditis auriculariae]|uniref:Succinate dehydrogenase assembly factor 2, mitochondrial n=1 Tax=Caenorhabditis auriculariae TaxID=2777116 RepID=A0A8S1HNN8_9PELO|nr:unnamed protein product [Caenorhabditis auriculariae]